MEEKIYHYWLCNIPDIGATKIRLLLECFGSAQCIYECTEEQLKQFFEAWREQCLSMGTHNPFTEKDYKNLLCFKEKIRTCEATFGGLARSGIGFITPWEDAYPSALRNLHDYPQGLYVKGKLPKEQQFKVAIVGARRCSSYGMEIAHYLGNQLALRGVCVVSGMAEGIDGAAHRGAIEGILQQKGNSFGMAGLAMPGSTLAVLGNGVDICYPRKNLDIYEELTGDPRRLAYGGLLSEIPVGGAPIPGNFPMRNRIISALADLLIVVEAKLKSGSLITADQALEQGKEVYVIPGRITDSLSLGCNNLIAQGAGIITDLDRFLEENVPICRQLELDFGSNCINQCEKQLAIPEEMVYSCLDFIPKHVGSIMEQSQLDLQELMVVIHQLQQKGLIKETSKNYYALKLI